MDFTEHIIGHSLAQDYLQKQLKNGTVHHANLVIGPDHVGKATLVFNLIYELLCPKGADGQPQMDSQESRMLQRDIHPNVTRIRPQDTGSIQLNQIKESLGQLALSSTLPGPRIVLIEDAHLLTLGAGNALLKVLEEPGRDVYFFLLTSSIDRILGTIRSRCAQVVLYPVADETLQNELALSFQDVRLVRGLPGVAVQWAKSNERETVQTTIQQWIQLFIQPTFAARRSVAEAWLPKTPTRPYLLKQLDYVEHVVRDILMLQLGMPEEITYQFALADLQTVQQQYTAEQSVSAVQFLKEIRIKLHQPVQPKLIIEELLLTCYRN